MADQPYYIYLLLVVIIAPAIPLMKVWFRVHRILMDEGQLSIEQNRRALIQTCVIAIIWGVLLAMGVSPMLLTHAETNPIDIVLTGGLLSILCLPVMLSILLFQYFALKWRISALFSVGYYKRVSSKQK